LGEVELLEAAWLDKRVSGRGLGSPARECARRGPRFAMMLNLRGLKP